jgi:hypothetical protein
MSVFSVARTRRHMSGPYGMVTSHLAHDFESEKQLKCLANCAESFLSTGVQCVLVGLDEQADQVIQKSRDWFTTAIELPEESSWAWGRGLQFVFLALCNWLLNNQHDAVSLGRASELLEAGLTTSSTDDNSRTIGLIALLWVCLEVGDYARIERLGEQYKVYPPPPADRLLQVETRGGTFCRVLARHKLGMDYTAEQIAAFLGVFEPYFSRSLLEELAFTGLAQFMKVLHWRGEITPPSAKDAVRLCLTDEYA